MALHRLIQSTKGELARSRFGEELIKRRPFYNLEASHFHQTSCQLEMLNESEYFTIQDPNYADCAPTIHCSELNVSIFLNFGANFCEFSKSNFTLQEYF